MGSRVFSPWEVTPSSLRTPLSCKPPRIALKSSESIDVRLQSQQLKEVKSMKYLGAHVSGALSSNDHFSVLRTKV